MQSGKKKNQLCQIPVFGEYIFSHEVKLMCAEHKELCTFGCIDLECDQGCICAKCNANLINKHPQSHCEPLPLFIYNLSRQIEAINSHNQKLFSEVIDDNPEIQTNKTYQKMLEQVNSPQKTTQHLKMVEEHIIKQKLNIAEEAAGLMGSLSDAIQQVKTQYLAELDKFEAQYKENIQNVKNIHDSFELTSLFRYYSNPNHLSAKLQSIGQSQVNAKVQQIKEALRKAKLCQNKSSKDLKNQLKQLLQVCKGMGDNMPTYSLNQRQTEHLHNKVQKSVANHFKAQLTIKLNPESWEGVDDGESNGGGGFNNLKDQLLKFFDFGSVSLQSTNQPTTQQLVMKQPVQENIISSSQPVPQQIHNQLALQNKSDSLEGSGISTYQKQQQQQQKGVADQQIFDLEMKLNETKRHFTKKKSAKIFNAEQSMPVSVLQENDESQLQYYSNQRLPATQQQNLQIQNQNIQPFSMTMNLYQQQQQQYQQQQQQQTQTQFNFKNQFVSQIGGNTQQNNFSKTLPIQSMPNNVMLMQQQIPPQLTQMKINNIYVSPDCKKMICDQASQWNELRIARKRTYQLEFPILCMIHLFDNIFAIGCKDLLIYIFDLKTQQVLQKIQSHSDQIAGLFKIIATGPQPGQTRILLASSGFDKTICLHAVTCKAASNNSNIVVCLQLENKLIGFLSTVHVLLDVQDQQTLITGDQEGEIVIWDFIQGKILFAFRGQHVCKITCIEYMRVKDQIVIASEDGTISIWRLQFSSLQKHKALNTLENIKNEGVFLGQACPFKGIYSLKVIDLPRMINNIQGITQSVIVAVGCGDGKIRIIDLNEIQQQQQQQYQSEYPQIIHEFQDGHGKNCKVMDILCIQSNNSVQNNNQNNASQINFVLISQALEDKGFICWQVAAQCFQNKVTCLAQRIQNGIETCSSKIVSVNGKSKMLFIVSPQQVNELLQKQDTSLILVDEMIKEMHQFNIVLPQQ